jgi:hypothetical protein
MIGRLVSRQGAWLFPPPQKYNDNILIDEEFDGVGDADRTSL